MDTKTKLKGILYMMHGIEKDLVEIGKSYADKRSNISESAYFSGNIITNIEGHIKDIETGVEE